MRNNGRYVPAAIQFYLTPNLHSIPNTNPAAFNTDPARLAAQAGCWSNVLDVAPRHPSVVLGIANTIGTFPGILCNLLTGWMLGAGWSWRAVFGLGACMELVGAITYGALASGEDQRFDSAPTWTSTVGRAQS